MWVKMWVGMDEMLAREKICLQTTVSDGWNYKYTQIYTISYTNYSLQLGSSIHQFPGLLSSGA